MRQLVALSKIGSVILGLLIIVCMCGCNGMPIKPTDVEKCALDLDAMEGVCGILGQSGTRREPIAYVDRAECFPPAEWEKVINYIHELEEYAKDKGKALLAPK